jgi:sorting and assembly machinery component 37/metaxin
MTGMQLYIWGPALNCSSIDPKCIAAETYLRLIKQKYTIVKCNDPQMSPTGRWRQHIAVINNADPPCFV